MTIVQSRLTFLTPQRFHPEYPLFVFLPGMDGTGQLLRAQTAGLETGFDVRSLAIPPDDLTSNWDVLAEKVVELIQTELNPASKRAVYLCGESFGGCLAMKVALHSPRLFDRIVLVNPASSFNSRPWITWGSQLTRWFPESLYRTASVPLMPFLANLGRIAAPDRQALYQTVQSVPQKTSIWRLSLLSEFCMSAEQLRQITQPVLLIAGGADRLLPSLAEVERLAQNLPNSQTVILPHSGHACLLEADVNLYEIMKQQQFLVGQPVGSLDA